MLLSTPSQEQPIENVMQLMYHRKLLNCCKIVGDAKVFDSCSAQRSYSVELSLFFLFEHLFECRENLNEGTFKKDFFTEVEKLQNGNE